MVAGGKYDHCQRKSGVVPWQKTHGSQGFDRCGITMDPAQSLVLSVLNVQTMSFSVRTIFISFLLSIIVSLGLVVDRLKGLSVPFLKLRTQQGRLPNLHWNVQNCSFWAMRRLVIWFFSFVLNNLSNDEGGRPAVEDGWLDAWLRGGKAGC